MIRICKNLVTRSSWLFSQGSDIDAILQNFMIIFHLCICMQYSWCIKIYKNMLSLLLDAKHDASHCSITCAWWYHPLWFAALLPWHSRWSIDAMKSILKLSWWKWMLVWCMFLLNWMFMSHKVCYKQFPECAYASASALMMRFKATSDSSHAILPLLLQLTDL